MSDNFKPGDTVQLKSGGPKMTIYNIDGSEAFCSWFEGNKRERGRFELTSLEKFDE